MAEVLSQLSSFLEHSYGSNDSHFSNFNTFFGGKIQNQMKKQQQFSLRTKGSGWEKRVTHSRETVPFRRSYSYERLSLLGGGILELTHWLCDGFYVNSLQNLHTWVPAIE